MKKTIQVANVAVFDLNNNVLLLKRSKNLKNPECWSLPGGLIDDEENAEDTVLRELFEETGIDRTKIDFVSSKTFLIENLDENVDMCLFRATLKFPVDIRLNESEHTDFRWIGVDQIKDLDSVIPKLLEMLR